VFPTYLSTFFRYPQNLFGAYIRLHIKLL
jgi:hypothetical protein